jgi:ribosomal protein S6
MVKKMYELTVAYSCEEAEYTAVKEAIEKLIEKTKIEIRTTDEWGEKEMSYRVKGHNRAMYVHYVVQCEPAAASKLNDKLRHETGVLRYLLVSTKELKKTKKDSK